MTKEQAKIPEWVKDLDLGRTAENFLMGAVLLVGRFLITQTHILFRPKKINDEILTISEYKDNLKLSYVRPLLFFALCAFLGVAFSQNTLGGISYVESIFDHYPFLSSSVSTEIKEFSLAKSVALMIPLVFIVALYAKISHLCFRILGHESAYRPHLSICAYICGSLFMVEALMSNFEMHLWGEPNTDNWFDDSFRPIVSWVGMLLCGGLGLLIIYRYFHYNKILYNFSFSNTLFYKIVSFLMFWISFIFLIFIFDPFLISLK